MGQRKKAILFSNPEVVAGVILMVMSIDHSFGMEFVAKFQKSFPAAGEPGIDQ
jgi:hypothetical protein